jgi:hypothetical protein
MATKKDNKRSVVRKVRRALNRTNEAPAVSNRRLYRQGYGRGANSTIELDADKDPE